MIVLVPSERLILGEVRETNERWRIEDGALHKKGNLYFVMALIALVSPV